MKGYTLIELLVVTTIILVLTLIMLPWAIGRIDVANANKTVAIIREVRRAYSLYRIDTGSNPPWFHLTNENPFLVDPGVAGWRGPYSNERSIPRSHPWKGAIGWDGEGGDCRQFLHPVLHRPAAKAIPLAGAVGCVDHAAFKHEDVQRLAATGQVQQQGLQVVAQLHA